MNINTKEWSAWINLMPGTEHKLIVVGKVETNASNLIPVLREAVPQGINPEILILELTIEDNGSIATPAVAFRNTRFEKSAEKGQYESVVIRHEGNVIQTIPVTEAH